MHFVAVSVQQKPKWYRNMTCVNSDDIAKTAAYFSKHIDGYLDTFLGSPSSYNLIDLIHVVTHLFHLR